MGRPTPAPVFHFTQDWGLPPLELHYLRDREKREVDFLLTLNQKP